MTRHIGFIMTSLSPMTVTIYYESIDTAFMHFGYNVITHISIHKSDKCRYLHCTQVNGPNLELKFL